MMIVFLYFFFLVIINDNQVASKETFDIFMMKSLVDKLGNKFEDVNNDFRREDFTCEGLDLLECYKGLLELYENGVQERTVNAINSQIKKKLNNYNELVLSLIFRSDVNNIDARAKDEFEDLIEIIRFVDSKVYCVIGFLSIFGKNLNDKLTDYIFFNDHSISNQKTMSDIKLLFKTHFKTRDDILKNIEVYPSKSENINDILKMKTSINEFAAPFCDLKFPWLKAQSWMWKGLIYSTDLISFFKNEKVKADYKSQMYTYNYSQSNLAKPEYYTGDQSNDLDPLRCEYSPQMEENNISDQGIDLDQIESKSPLQKKYTFESFFQKEYHQDGSKKIDGTYHILGELLDSFVSKVLFSNIMQIMVNALETYRESMVREQANYNNDEINLNLAKERNVRKFLYLGYNFELFRVLLELYNSNRPPIVDQNAMRKMDEALNFFICKYKRYVLDENNTSDLANKIVEFLEDERFHQESDNLMKEIPKDLFGDWNYLSEKLRETNIYIAHLIELKRPT